MRRLTLLMLLMMCLVHGCGGGGDNVAENDSPEQPEKIEANAAPAPSQEEAEPLTPSTETPVADAPSTGTIFDRVPADTAAIISIRPSKAMNNPMFPAILELITDSNPQVNSEEALADFEKSVGVAPEQVEQILICFDGEILTAAGAMGMMFLQMGMGPGMGQLDPAFPAEEFAVAANGQVDLDRATSDELTPVAFQPGIGPPQTPPPPVILVQLVPDVDIQNILDSVPEGEPIDLQTGKGVKTADGVVLPLSDSQLIFGPQIDLETVPTDAGTGPISAALTRMQKQDIGIALDMQTVTKVIGELQGDQPNPMIGMAMTFLQQVKTASIASDLEDSQLLQAKIDAINADSAQGLQSMLNSYLAMGKQQFEKSKSQLPEHDEFRTLVSALVDQAAISTEGTLITVNVPRPEGFENLPNAIQQVAEMERKKAEEIYVPRNNMKQIGLAFHNYHDVYKSLPAADSNGVAEKLQGKGLSWRVHLLPFLEQAPLYEQFHLDEPWDSEHNKTLIQEMPAAFGTNPDGKTSIHAFTGGRTLFQEGEPGLGLRDITDGTSNTILAVKAGDDTAEIWTKPGGLEYNEEEPFAPLGDIGDQFLALFCDGSITDIPKSLDPAEFRRLIDPRDGEPVNFR
ncbi:hypothetical protein KOR42_43980 [Thalassoglobus neptunius]|uniref:DUF1559 domain-containing protein n=1 Tax=Thalassoglobus neptunius TaxID=1938619 RepID=A0A5C5VYQ5_9PLAN|nr:DUF1559 domain-containing protein [Thalassoglobus neptunius]TWT43580.1 hypothetical protein KOR42_43980 [Thalassoglobus neptunius]